MGCIKTKNTRDKDETYINQAAIDMPTVNLPIDSDRENELLKMDDVQRFLNQLKDVKLTTVSFGFGQFLETSADEDDVVLLGCKKLQEYRRLESLRIALGGTLVSCNGMSTLAKVIPRFKTLDSLDLSLNRGLSILDVGITAFSAALREFKNLQTLNIDISETFITDSGLTALSESLKELKNIKTLNLNVKPQFDINRPDMVFVSDVGAVPLFSAIGELKNLEKLDILFKENHLADKGAIALSSSLKSLKSLKYLSILIGETKVRDEGALAISAAVKDLKAIDKFDFFLPTAPDVSSDAKDEIRNQVAHIKRNYIS